ncbi:RHS repeat-associated core domain-containing protein [Trinickia sp. NRRL B-1857]|uniref:RHS repeat-associated core domain-containing protein n=1 Tax=Trinickia sp. NRRL B-1857 TaxID=3162879 RepID=UPI003D26F356
MNTMFAQGFTGAFSDPITAAVPLGNGYRFYLPGLMRFNAPDDESPFGVGGPNPYAYCAGDPINRVDPTGHFSFFDIFTYIGKGFETVFNYTSVAWLTVNKILPALGATVPKAIVKAESVVQSVVQDVTFIAMAVVLSVFTDGASLELLGFVAANLDIISGDLAVASDVTSAIPGRGIASVTKGLSLGAMVTGAGGGISASFEAFAKSATKMADVGEIAQSVAGAVRGSARAALDSTGKVTTSLFKRVVRLVAGLSIQTIMNSPALLIPFTFDDPPRVEPRVENSGRLGLRGDAPPAPSNNNQNQSRVLAQSTPLAG